MKNRFDSAAESWDLNPSTIDLHSAICKELESKIVWDSNWNVLDFGTGTGNLASYLSSKVSHITAMDNSEGMLKILQEKLKQNSISNISVKLHSAGNDRLPFQTFNAIVSSMTFHHIANITEFFKECFEALRPGGILIGIDLVQEDGGFHREHDDTIKHFGFNPSKISDTLLKIGFTKTEISVFYSLCREHNKKSYPIFMVTAYKN